MRLIALRALSVDANVPADYARLLRLARAGDASSLGRLLEMYGSYLALLARMHIGKQLQSRVDPSDLVQETFAEASHRFGQFRGSTESELVGWLRQILASKILDTVRRNIGAERRDVRLEQQLANELSDTFCRLGKALIAPQSSPSEQAAKREHAVLLAMAMSELPEDYREVLVLRNLQGLTFPEVAQQMGRSLDSVKNLWTRALTKLRHSLGNSI